MEGGSGIGEAEGPRGIVARRVPIVARLPHYDRRWLRADALAGLSVWALLVPVFLELWERAGVVDALGDGSVFETVAEAVAALGTGAQDDAPRSAPSSRS